MSFVSIDHALSHAHPDVVVLPLSEGNHVQLRSPSARLLLVISLLEMGRMTGLITLFSHLDLTEIIFVSDSGILQYYITLHTSSSIVVDEGEPSTV